MAYLHILIFGLLMAACLVSSQLTNVQPEAHYIEMLTKMYAQPQQIPEKVNNDWISAVPQPQVQTSSGLAHGISTDHDQSFYGIPYAQPPIGNLRYQPPKQLDTPHRVYNKTYQDGLTCYQYKPHHSQNEDCLILDIHVPSHVNLSDSNTPPDARLPVLFSIHGGAFILGSGTGPLFEGRYLANATNTIIVSINYRLGPLGFLVHGKGDDPIIGNQGFKDQQLALQWVQNNIEKFGGNKTQVTIFGESAGGQSVMFHLLSYVSDPHFHHAIMQSNPTLGNYPTFDESAKVTQQVIQFLRCGYDNFAKDCCGLFRSDQHCLMNASPQQLMYATRRIMRHALTHHIYQAIEPFRPIIDGVEFTKQPMQLFKEGKWQKHKPIITGTTSEELVHLQRYFSDFNNLTKNKYRALNLAVFKRHGAKISHKYLKYYGPNITNYNYGKLFGIEMTHLLFTCSTRALARYASATTNASVYLYVFSHALGGPGCEDIYRKLCNTSSHTTELPFVYRTMKHMGMNPAPKDEVVMDQFSTYWGGMARTGKPSGGLDTPLEGIHPEWLPYMKSEQNTWKSLRIDDPEAHMENNYTEEICNFWDSLMVYMEPLGVPPTVPPTTTPTEFTTTTLATLATLATNTPTEFTNTTLATLATTTPTEFTTTTLATNTPTESTNTTLATLATLATTTPIEFTTTTLATNTPTESTDTTLATTTVISTTNNAGHLKPFSMFILASIILKLGF